MRSGGVLLNFSRFFPGTVCQFGSAYEPRTRVGSALRYPLAKGSITLHCHPVPFDVRLESATIACDTVAGAVRLPADRSGNPRRKRSQAGRLLPPRRKASLRHVRSAAILGAGSSRQVPLPFGSRCDPIVLQPDAFRHGESEFLRPHSASPVSRTGGNCAANFLQPVPTEAWTTFFRFLKQI